MNACVPTPSFVKLQCYAFLGGASSFFIFLKKLVFMKPPSSSTIPSYKLGTCPVEKREGPWIQWVNPHL